MSEKPISPLRACMLEDMTVRNFVPATQREYVRAVKKLAAFLKRSPDTATADDLRTFQVHLTESSANVLRVNDGRPQTSHKRERADAKQVR